MKETMSGHEEEGTRREGMMKMSSGVLPELEMAMMTSSAVMTPRSPWAASVACTKNDEMPSDENDALIFCAIIPTDRTPNHKRQPPHTTRRTTHDTRHTT